MVELGSFELDFKSRATIKSQALVDFLAEWTEIQTPASIENLEYWTMYFDGSLMVEGAARARRCTAADRRDLAVSGRWKGTRVGRQK